MKKILYFINGPVPTEAERLDAESLGAVFRNRSAAGNDFTENCDAVAGNAPEAYLKRFPSVTHKATKTLNSMGESELRDYAVSKGIELAKDIKGKKNVLAFIEEQEKVLQEADKAPGLNGDKGNGE